MKVTTLEPPFSGRFYQPEARTNKPAVICLSGSDGRQPDVLAAVLASLGYPAIALCYFGRPGLNPTLKDVPVELVLNLKKWLEDKTGISSIGIIGFSKGAELAMVCATHTSFAFVVGAAPSAYVFQGLADFTHPSSSWSYGGCP